MKGFNGFQLKVIMVVLMVIDHVGQFIPGSPLWFRYIGRLAAPVFFYLLVEGFVHTRSRRRYMERLFIGGAIMLCGSTILMHIFNGPQKIINNIFLSMGVNIVMLSAIEWKNKEETNKALAIGIIIVSFILALFTEGGLSTILLVLIFYYNRNSKIKMSFWYILASFLYLTGPSKNIYESLFITNYQWMMVFALPFMLMYNGERGKKAKYFFYVFYPLHIWVLYILGNYIKF